jgi:hypothetical protein
MSRKAAKPKSQQRRTRPGSTQPADAATASVLPMDIQIGDRFTDAEGEWEVVSHPATLHGAKLGAERDDESDPMNRLRYLPGLTPSVLVAFLITGCSALTQGASPSAAYPPLHRAPGGGYVPGDTTYHGSGGP